MICVTPSVLAKTVVCLTCDSRDEVGFLELNPVSARLFGLLQEQAGGSGLELLQQIAEELQHTQPEIVVQGGTQILEQWRRLGVVRGVGLPSQ